MKPWEEEWYVDNGVIRRNRQPDEIGKQYVGEGMSPERARLAAQAPKMARLLCAIYENGPECDPDYDLIWTILHDAGVK
jgi:hypothetical protein